MGKATNSDGIADYYDADVESARDYYPFGMTQPGREYTSNMYRYGFNGKEDDKNWGVKFVQDYGFRLYNPALGRFLSVDALRNEYPFYGPYNFAGNKPIGAIDLDGLQEKWVTIKEHKDYFGAIHINRRDIQVKVDKDAILENVETGQRVAVTHVTVIDPDGNVKSEGDIIEVLDNTGKMANGYYPTARYDLSTSGELYAKEKELAETENGFEKIDVLESYLPWKVDYDKFDEHLATAPEYAIFKKDLALVKSLVLKRVNPPKSIVDPNLGAKLNIPKPPTGKGKVKPADRDPKRTFSQKQRKEMLERQKGKCAICKKPKKLDETVGHHIIRYADGVPTNLKNGVAVCKSCHINLHKKE